MNSELADQFSHGKPSPPKTMINKFFLPPISIKRKAVSEEMQCFKIDTKFSELKMYEMYEGQ